MSGLCKECGCDAEGCKDFTERALKRIAELEAELKECRAVSTHWHAHTVRLRRRLELIYQYTMRNLNYLGNDNIWGDFIDCNEDAKGWFNPDGSAK